MAYRLRTRWEYKVQIKVDGIVQKNMDEIKSRLNLSDGCPLQGYSIDAKVESGSVLPHLDEHSISAARGQENREGCLAQHDAGCYLKKRSARHLQVPYKELCPVYQRILEVIAGLK